MRDNEGAAGFICGVGVGVLLHIFIVVVAGLKHQGVFQQEAVEAGVGKYKCDEKTGVAEFIWIKPEGETK